MPITNITHDACRYTAELGVSAKYFTHITPGSNHTAYMHVCLQGIGCVCIKKYPPKLMQPSSSTPATIVSAENQNDATIVKAIFFFCPYYIVWESNNAGEARKQSWNESLQSRCIPGGLCGLCEWYKAKTFCCTFFVAAMLSMVAAATIVRSPPPPPPPPPPPVILFDNYWYPGSLHFWSSAAMLFNLQDQWTLVFHDKWFKPPEPS